MLAATDMLSADSYRIARKLSGEVTEKREKNNVIKFKELDGLQTATSIFPKNSSFNVAYASFQLKRAWSVVITAEKN